ncbi:MAG: hypothetical protein IPM42_17275 [Saprospiraceae bacterium]|nr:hypothetical protein [Saprospiraceae bacterium]
MKTRELILLVSLTFMIYAAHTQSVINIKEKNTLTSKELKEVKSINFLDGNLRLNLTSGDLLTYALSEVQKIDFDKTISSIGDELNIKGASALIYPNPSNGNEVTIIRQK